VGSFCFYAQDLLKMGESLLGHTLVGKLLVFSSSNHSEESLSCSLVGKLYLSSPFLVFYNVFALFSYHLFIQSHVEIQEGEKDQNKSKLLYFIFPFDQMDNLLGFTLNQICCKDTGTLHVESQWIIKREKKRGKT
jgi:hypothetical protein